MSAVRKALCGVMRKGARPDDTQLAAINRLAVEPQTADSVYVRTAWAGHNAIDRDGEVIDDALLVDIGITLVGKGLHLRHPSGWDGDSGPGVGRVFDTRIVSMSLDDARTALREPELRFPPGAVEAHLLEASFFIPRTSKNADLLADIDAGVAGDVSLGFMPGPRAPVTDDAGTQIATRLQSPGEGYELSLVWLGAQPGARVHKAAKGGDHNHDEDHHMTVELQKQITDLQAANGTLQSKLDKALAAVSSLEAIRKAVGGLADDPQALAKAVQAGNDYTAALVDDIVTAERHLKLTGDSDDEVAAAKAVYVDYPITKLKALCSRLDAMVPKSPTDELGGEPNLGSQDGGVSTDKAKRTQSDPIHNPMLNKSATA